MCAGSRFICPIVVVFFLVVHSDHSPPNRLTNTQKNSNISYDHKTTFTTNAFEPNQQKIKISIFETYDVNRLIFVTFSMLLFIWPTIYYQSTWPTMFGNARKQKKSIEIEFIFIKLLDALIHPFPFIYSFADTACMYVCVCACDSDKYSSNIL